MKRYYYKEYQKKYREKHKEYFKKYYQNNKEKYYYKNKKYFEKQKLNPDYIHPEILARFGRDPKEILKQDNWSCQQCGSKENLIIHHIDGQGRNSKNPNNSLDNLITLCRSCHSRLHSKKYWTAKKMKGIKMNEKLKQMIRESNFFDRRKNILEYYNTSDLKVEGVQEEITVELVAADQKVILDSYDLETGNGVEDYLTEEAKEQYMDKREDEDFKFGADEKMYYSR